jgi:hypothetical protein
MKMVSLVFFSHVVRMMTRPQILIATTADYHAVTTGLNWVRSAYPIEQKYNILVYLNIFTINIVIMSQLIVPRIYFVTFSLFHIV